jgi:2-C-methyl-D-erythritol 4-phosphate cytidylyltransferase
MEKETHASRIPLPSSPEQNEVAILVPAAGQGKRLGGNRKQFRRLGGQPLLVQTLRVFERHPEVNYILVAAPDETVAILEAELHNVGLSKLVAVVPGGETRQESVAAALGHIPPDVGVVLVHDAVRPFVEAQQISDIIYAVRVVGAAALAIPVVDTMRQGRSGVFEKTVPRDALYRMQTPQGFWRAWFQEAHAWAAAQRIEATDDVELVQRLGHTVQIVPGNPRNIKITTPADWELALLLWPHWEAALAG